MRLGGTLTPCSAEGGCALSWHQVLWSPVTLAADVGCGSLLLEPLRGVSVWCSHHPLCLMTMRFLPQGCGGGCLQGYSVPLMGKRGESRLPAAGGSGNDRGSRLLCPVYTWAGGCETARRKREVHTSYLPHFALNVKILKV